MPSRVPPGPRGHWLKGNLHDFAYRRLDFFTDLRESMAMSHPFDSAPVGSGWSTRLS